MQSQATRKINAREAARDFQSGMTDLELMRKYEISPTTLKKLRGKLEAAGLLPIVAPPPTPVSEQRAPSAVEFRCPACGSARSQAFEECPHCGVIVAKFKRKASANAHHAKVEESEPGAHSDSSGPRTVIPFPETSAHVQEEPEDEDTAPEVRTFTKENWRTLLIGAGVALTAMFFFWPRWILETFRTLTHEFGHAVLGWLFGYPSLPAFDMLHGGGITAHFGRSGLLLFAIYAAVAGLMFLYRKNIKTVMALSVALLIHAFVAFTDAHNVLILWMGHGMELFFGMLFIYRSLSGHAIVHEAERPLYAIVGFFLIFANISFAMSLLWDQSFLAEYMDGKGGILDNDFVRIAQDHLRVRMRAVVYFFLFASFMSPIIAVGYYLFDQYAAAALLALLPTNPKAESS